MRTDNDTWDITTSVGSTALFVAASRALEANKPDPLVVDPYAEMFCRAVGGEWADVLDGKAPENKLTSEFGDHFVNFQAARTKFFDTTSMPRPTPVSARSSSRQPAWTPAPTGWPGPNGTVVFELDQPQVLEFKRDVLAAAAKRRPLNAARSRSTCATTGQHALLEQRLRPVERRRPGWPRGC